MQRVAHKLNLKGKSILTSIKYWWEIFIGGGGPFLTDPYIGNESPENVEIINSLTQARLDYMSSYDYINAELIDEFLLEEGIQIVGDWYKEQWRSKRVDGDTLIDVSRLKLVEAFEEKELMELLDRDYD